MVQRMVDGRYLSAAEEVVQRAVDLGLVQTQARDRVVVDHQTRLHPCLCVGVDVASIGASSSCAAPAAPRRAVGDGVRLQRCTGTGRRRASADADVLHRLQEQVRARLVRELAAQTRDHGIRVI